MWSRLARHAGAGARVQRRLPGDGVVQARRESRHCHCGGRRRASSASTSGARDKINRSGRAADRRAARRSSRRTCSATTICPPRGAGAGRVSRRPRAVPRSEIPRETARVPRTPEGMYTREATTIDMNLPRARNAYKARRAALPRGRRRDRRRPGDPRRARPVRHRLRDLSDRRRLARRPGGGGGAARQEGRGPRPRQAHRRAERARPPAPPLRPEPRARERRRGRGAAGAPATTRRRAAPSCRRCSPSCRATLVAHRAQFEVEVLLSHGVALDIECTLADGQGAAGDRLRQGAAGAAGRVLASPPWSSASSAGSATRRIRDRDWRVAESLDEEAIDVLPAGRARRARAASQLYRARLEAEGLLDGYRLIQQAILPTAPSTWSGWSSTPRRTARSPRICAAAPPASSACSTRSAAARSATTAARSRSSKWIVDQVLAGDYADDPNRLGNFVARLCAVTGERGPWRLTKTKHLAITKSVKARQARALAPHYPVVARYLRASALLTKVEKLADSFGESLGAVGRPRRPAARPAGGRRHHHAAPQRPASADAGDAAAEVVPAPVPRAAGAPADRLRLLADRAEAGGDRRAG